MPTSYEPSTLLDDPDRANDSTIMDSSQQQSAVAHEGDQPAAPALAAQSSVSATPGQSTSTSSLDVSDQTSSNDHRPTSSAAPPSAAATNADDDAPDPPELPLPPPASSAAQPQPADTPSTPSSSGFGFGIGALVDAFLTGFRNAAGGSAPASQSQEQRQGEQSSSTTAAPASSSGAPDGSAAAQEQSPSSSADAGGDRQAEQGSTAGPNDTSNNSTDEQPSTLFFRMPFAGPDGSPALLAFTPGPLPRESNQVGQRPDQPPTSPGNGNGSAPQPAFGPERPPATTNGDAAAAAANGQQPSEQRQRFHVPVAPIFVPLGASPLPFSFIFDAVSSTAWPVVSVSSAAASTAGGTPPGGMPAEGGGQPRLVAGPPFHIMLDINFGPPPPPPEQPDPERAARFVASLERADAELRERMKILGIGEIGHYGGGDEEDAEVGCGICLDSYEDRPAWLDGLGAKENEARDGECVAVPCAGHHTLHAGCLRSYLASKVVKDWSCPFCRASLCPAKVEESAANGGRGAEGASSAEKKAIQEAAKRTLREEIRLRERQRGWRCDNPACLPRYPQTKPKEGQNAAATSNNDDDDNEDEDQELVELKPCHHQIHLDCLLLSQRLEFPASDEESGDDDEDEEESVGDEEEGEDANVEGSEAASEAEEEEEEPEPEPVKPKTVGRWVQCPCCRKEAWAVIPVRRRRSAGAGAKAGEGEGKRRRRRRCSGRKGGERKRRKELEGAAVEGAAQGVEAV